jgi:hypothetical protein
MHSWESNFTIVVKINIVYRQVGNISKYKILIIVLFVETLRKFITAKLSIRKPGSSSVLII